VKKATKVHLLQSRLDMRAPHLASDDASFVTGAELFVDIGTAQI
jgi:hypothetical protein